MRLSMGSVSFAAKKPAKSLAPGQRQAVVIAVAAQKGGVGKTTTTVSLGAALARYYGQHVLLVDLDAQAHVHLALRELVHVGGDSLAELLEEPTTREVAEVAVGTKIPNLEITPGCPELARAENRLSTRIGNKPFFSSVPSGRVGTDLDCVFASDEQFREVRKGLGSWVLGC